MEKDFDLIRSKGEAFYKSILSARCPYLQADVHFNAQGLEHIKFKKHGRTRAHNDQRIRFKLFRFAPEILKLSRTLQGIRETKHFEKIRTHGRTDYVLLPVTYYEFVAVMEHIRCKVIVKQIEGGQKFFWSIIPFWGIDRETRKRKLYSGDPEID